MEKCKQSEKKLLPEFDQAKELELLDTLKKSGRNAENKHFAYIELQKFYYKYRNNDPKYLKLCKQYCEKDIELLPKVDESYIKREVNTIKRLMAYHNSATKINYMERIENIKKDGFRASIPAFKRLSIICEKENDFDGAIKYCDAEINYYLSHGIAHDSDTVQEIYKRREKLIAKQNKLMKDAEK